MVAWREWLGSAHAETVTEDQHRRGATARALLCATAILIDLGIYATFASSPLINQSVLRFFFIANVALLSFAGLSSYLGIAKPKRPQTWLSWVAIPTELLAVMIWIQVTGVVSSYFIIVGPLVFVVYRAYYSHAFGLYALLTFIALHLGAFGLEELGVLRSQSLFVEPPTGLYAWTQFRWTAMSSILWTYGLTFIGANLAVNKLRRNERELASAERRLVLAAEGARHGRLTGMQLADIEIGELLGRGGMGEVYKGKLGGEIVAVKVLHPHLVGDERLFARFRREAAAAALVVGGYCPRILRAASEPYPYIAMELLEGEDLAAHFRRRGPLPLDEVINLAESLAAALDAIHRAGIVHRDLTPANIFLLADHVETDGPRVKLLDLGICKLRSPDVPVTQQSAIVGTPGFLAPEQAQGRGDLVGPASDVFALGAILYRALTGVLPFTAGDLLSAIEQVCTVEPQPPSELRRDLPPDFDDVLAWAMAKQIGDRYASAAAFVLDLRLAAKGELPSARRGRAVRQRAALGYAATLSPAEAGRTPAG